MQRQEIHNYTSEQVAQHVADAIALADEADVDPVRWAAVFTAALGLYSGKQIVMTQAPTLDFPNLHVRRG
jgi:hypothetical protein